MKTFAQSALSYLDAREGSAGRLDAWNNFSALGLPTTVDEVWRYAPLGDLDLDHFALAQREPLPSLSALSSALAERAGLVVRIVDGYLIDVTGALEGISVETAESQWSSRYESDAFAQLNCALTPSTITLRVAENVNVSSPTPPMSCACGSNRLPVPSWQRASKTPRTTATPGSSR